MADPRWGGESKWLCDICYLTDEDTFKQLVLSHQLFHMLRMLAFCTHMILAAVKELSDKVDALDEAIAR